MDKKIQTDIFLDPEIEAFVSLLQERAAAHPPLYSLTYPEMRAVAEDVRRPLTQGGPELDHTFDYSVNVGTHNVKVRVINAAPGERRPALIYLHGGGWMIFSLGTHDRVMREFAARADIAVIGIEYSLSPDVRFPTQLEEIQAVHDWLQSEGIAIGIDTSRLVIGGDSVGANLSVATCLMLRDNGLLDSIQGMLLCYGAYDGGLDTDSYHRYGDPRFNLGRDEMKRFWECYVRDTNDYQNSLVSPLNADLHDLPPTCMIIAECDVLHSENIQMAEKLRSYGVDVESRVYTGTTHSFLEAISMAAVSDRAFSYSSRWLRSVLSQA